MSSYLDDPDTDSDTDVIVCNLSEEEIAAVKAQCAELKAEGNACFTANDFDGALVKYTVSYC
jgi:hypothetical protein